MPRTAVSAVAFGALGFVGACATAPATGAGGTLQRVDDCQLARNAALGHDVPERFGFAVRAHAVVTPSACASYWTEAIYRNYGYDHWVYILNDCTERVTCSVWSDDVSRSVQQRVEPGQVAQVMTFMGAPWRAFEARVDCVRG